MGSILNPLVKICPERSEEARKWWPFMISQSFHVAQCYWLRPMLFQMKPSIQCFHFMARYTSYCQLTNAMSKCYMSNLFQQQTHSLAYAVSSGDNLGLSIFFSASRIYSVYLSIWKKAIIYSYFSERVNTVIVALIILQSHSGWNKVRQAWWLDLGIVGICRWWYARLVLVWPVASLLIIVLVHWNTTPQVCSDIPTQTIYSYWATPAGLQLLCAEP